MQKRNNQRKRQNFLTENYWRSAIICLVIAGIARQIGPDIPAEREIYQLVIEDIANIGAMVFLVAGVIRVIDNRRKRI